MGQVLAALRCSSGLSRAAVAAATGLSRGTVAAAAGALLANGLVEETAPRPTGGLGRPAVLLRLSRQAGLAAGLDVGKRHVRVAVSDLGQDVLGERLVEVAPDLPAGDALDLAVGLLDEVLAEAGAPRAALLGAGLAVPGPLHTRTGVLGSATILPGWVGVRPVQEVQRRLAVPVRADNDANLGALAEWTWGAGRGCDDLAYLKLATGIGCGLVVGGRPCRGTGGTAGEIGHLVVVPDGPVCRCGNRGCLETVAGTEAVRDLLRPALGDLPVAHVVDRALAGDAASRRVLGDTGALVGQAVASLVNLLNPALLVVGGPLAAAGDVLLGPLGQAVRRSAIPSAAEDLQVVPSALGDRAEVLGALALALRELPLRRTVPAVAEAASG